MNHPKNLESTPIAKAPDRFSLSKSKHLVAAAALTVGAVVSSPAHAFELPNFLKVFSSKETTTIQHKTYPESDLVRQARSSVFGAYENYRINPSRQALEELRKAYTQWEKVETRSARTNPPFPDNVKSTLVDSGFTFKEG